MASKFFSLIKKDADIHIGPDTEIIPAEAFSSLLTAKELVEAVKDDAEDYRRSVVEECEIIKEQAGREGFEEGMQQWSEHIAELEREIEAAHEEVRKLVAPLALKAAKKILGKELELKPEATADIVANSLRSVAQHKKIVIYVNKKDLEVLEAAKPRLRNLFERLESLSIQERSDIESGGCVIETEAGIINAQLSNQWEKLERAFASLMKSEK